MKKATTFLALIAIASSASAHTAAAPHSHLGGQVSWLPALACIAALTTAACIGMRFRKNRRSR